MISQHWFRKWLGAVRQQAITWADVDPDLCRHMASLGPNVLNLFAPRESCYEFRCMIIKHILLFDILSIVLKPLPQDHICDKSALVQVMAQYSSMMPYGVTRGPKG